MLDEGIQLDERPGIQEQLDPLAGKQLPARPLPLDGRARTRVKRLLAQALERLQPFPSGVFRHAGEPTGAPAPTARHLPWGRIHP